MTTHDNLSNEWTIGTGTLTCTIAPNGEVSVLRDGENILINQYRGGIHDHSPAGIYLRELSRTDSDSVISSYRLVGTGLELRIGANQAEWISYPPGWKEVRTTLTVEDDKCAWSIALTADENRTESRDFDIAFTQDISLSPPEVAQSSEPYVCQYIAHHPGFSRENGWSIASRQTMTATPAMPTLVTRMTPFARGYLTDGMQFYGASARASYYPKAMMLREWENRNYQYEIASPSLLSSEFSNGASHQVNVFLDYFSSYEADLDSLLGAPSQNTQFVISRDLSPVSTASESMLLKAPVLNGRIPTDSELLAFAGHTQVCLAETDDDGSLWSFFSPNGTHIVRGDKEMVVERPHGHIIRAGDDISPSDNILSTTSYASGVFASHVVIGNTSANRIVTVNRHPLGIMASHGIRILVSDPEHPDAQPYRLSVPSAFSIDIGAMKWLYLTDIATIEVAVYASAECNQLAVQATADRPLTWRMSVGIEADNNQPIWDLEATDPQTVVATPKSTATVQHPAASHYPDMAYVFTTSGTWDGNGPHLEGEDSVFFTTDKHATSTHLKISADLENQEAALTIARERAQDCDEAIAGHQVAIREFTGNLFLAGASSVSTGIAEELNILIPWYVHNALIHLLVPHGLEQYSGAAWGTRDICQGPCELLLTFGHFSTVREILLTVFTHQYDNGNFPQWFMFDKYEHNYSDTSHGDVVVWPLFALGQYLKSSGDTSILEENVPFWNPAQRRPFDDGSPLLAHVQRALDYLSDHKVAGTALPAYEHGDWDDTLQPADASMRTTMASGWTTALLYQTLMLLSAELAQIHSDLASHCRAAAKEVADDFRTYLLRDGVVAGYALPSATSSQVILHPQDTRTGLHYRLIPMTRSIIAELLTFDESAQHLDLILRQLHFPDGVHLMDRFAPYAEGPTTHFLRAEQAANVGREVGLMYTHAHIRYVESLAKYGNHTALSELMRISPVGINHRLPQAHPRQRNTYYSSSDAAFYDRFEATSGIDLLREGKVGVKGGWRVYSSGPGIFLHQLIANVLGLELTTDSVIFDPVLPSEAIDLEIQWKIAGSQRRIKYRTQTNATCVSVDAGESFESLSPVPAEPYVNVYRHNGACVRISDLEQKDCILVTIPTD